MKKRKKNSCGNKQMVMLFSVKGQRNIGDSLSLNGATGEEFFTGFTDLGKGLND